LASSLNGGAKAQPGQSASFREATEARKPDTPGRARRKPLKPLRAGTSGDSGVLVVTRVRSTNTKCTRGRGCNGHPAFPTPSLGGRFINGSGASRGEVVNVCLMDTSTPSRHRRRRSLKDTDLILRRPRSGRLEGWTQRRDSRPSFETRARGALLRMRSEIYSEPRKRAIQYCEASVMKSQSRRVLDTRICGEAVARLSYGPDICLQRYRRSIRVCLLLDGA
jgi:hypothetical protein